MKVIKLRYFFIPIGIILLCLWWYSASNTKELTMYASTEIDLEVGKTALILKARFIELPFGLLYINAALNFNGDDYVASHKIISPKVLAQPWRHYDISFEDLVKENLLMNSTLRVSGKSFTDMTQVQLLFTKIDHGVLRSNVFECDVDEWRIE